MNDFIIKLLAGGCILGFFICLVIGIRSMKKNRKHALQLYGWMIACLVIHLLVLPFVPLEENSDFAVTNTWLKTNETNHEAKDQLSLEFYEYNRQFYIFYKNYVEKLGSTIDSENLDEIITWTNEFNQLLHAYEEHANPTNEIDFALYEITKKMISNQREANKQLIQGQESNDNTSFAAAGEYLDKVLELYLEGNKMLELRDDPVMM